MTDHLFQHLAPITDAAWKAIEDDVKPRLKAHLAARKLIDFEGPLGWDYSATNLGRAYPIPQLLPELTTSQRAVLPLIEARADFVLSRTRLDDVGRGARDVDLSALDTVARQIALAENQTVFHGYRAAGITGMTEASSHEPIVIEKDVNQYPAAVARAVNVLRQAGIGGPYGLALAPDIYTEITETTEHGGYPLFDHLRAILGGALVWAPGVNGGVVVSQRGGDFVFECGQDIAIGYAGHDANEVNLYLQETYSFRVLEPGASIALPAGDRSRGRRRG
jgi:uncharacterized linocin/CFP29 family protein